MELIGHRGCGDHNPENTVTAITEAAERLPAVEVDLRRCRSGEIVAFHDERVGRLTGGEGRLAELEWNELRALSVAGSGERIARLEEIVDAAPADVTLQFELKEPGLSAETMRLLEARRADVRLSSFSAPALAEIRRRDWDVETGLLFDGDPDANVDLAHALGCDNLHPPAAQCLETDVVERAHDEGFGVYAWGLDDPETVTALRERGVDGVTTDRWDVTGGSVRRDDAEGDDADRPSVAN